MTPSSSRERHPDRCACHACRAGGELAAATPNSELALEQSGRLDPTGTTTIQRELARLLRGRFADLNAEVRRRIVEEDVFGLNGDGAWADAPREAQLMRFEDWFDDVADRVVLKDMDGEEIRAYLVRAAERGIRDGHADLREFGVDTDDVDDVVQQDTVQTQLDDVQDELGTRVGRAVNDFGSDARRLANAGLATGVARRQLAADIGERASVYQSHVTTQASGEVVNQYNTTQLTAYDRVDAEVDLQVDVEYVDAGDEKVCQRCLALSSQNWTLERAQQEQPIPQHDGCRCRFSVTDVRKMF